jgi:hypothetical protein
METEEKFIKKLFDENKTSFDKHIEACRLINDFSIVWSDTYLGFYPFQSEMNQSKPAKIYKKEPKESIGKILNKYNDKNELYYSCKYKQEYFGTVFYFYNEIENYKIMYIQNKSSWDISQIDYLKIMDKKIIGRIFFLKNSSGKDTFYYDRYIYGTSNKLEIIKRNGYNYGKENLLPERTFRFEYDDDNLLKIYSKMLKANGENIENEIYSKNKVILL